MELLSVTMNDGVMPRSEIEGKDSSSEDKSNYKVVCKGDMVYNSMRMWQGANGVSDYDGIVSPAYTVLMPTKEIDNQYFAALFKTSKLINEFRKNSQGLTSDTWNLKYPQIRPIRLHIPSLQEQHKLSAFIGTLEERISKQRQLVDSLKKYKRGLLNSLITQKLKFTPGQIWRTTKLGDIFQERTERAIGDEELLAVTIRSGVQKRDEINLKDNSSDDKSHYKRVYKGDLVYNTMRMWQGASGVSLFDGIVSPAYTVVTPIDAAGTNIIFWSYYFKFVPLVRTFQKYSQGLTSDTWNLKFPQFSEIKVSVPSLKEQTSIADFLSRIDKKIQREENQLRACQRLRTALMQQLFI